MTLLFLGSYWLAGTWYILEKELPPRDSDLSALRRDTRPSHYYVSPALLSNCLHEEHEFF